jgi:hypothetical protein
MWNPSRECSGHEPHEAYDTSVLNHSQEGSEFLQRGETMTITKFWPGITHPHGLMVILLGLIDNSARVAPSAESKGRSQSTQLSKGEHIRSDTKPYRRG